MGGLVTLLPFTSTFPFPFPLLVVVVAVVCPGNELYIRFMLIFEWFCMIFLSWWFCMMLPFVIVLIGLVLDRPCFSSSVVEKL